MRFKPLTDFHTCKLIVRHLPRKETKPQKHRTAEKARVKKYMLRLMEQVLESIFLPLTHKTTQSYITQIPHP